MKFGILILFSAVFVIIGIAAGIGGWYFLSAPRPHPVKALLEEDLHIREIRIEGQQRTVVILDNRLIEEWYRMIREGHYASEAVTFYRRSDTSYTSYYFDVVLAGKGRLSMGLSLQRQLTRFALSDRLRPFWDATPPYYLFKMLEEMSQEMGELLQFLVDDKYRGRELRF